MNVTIKLGTEVGFMVVAVILAVWGGMPGAAIFFFSVSLVFILLELLKRYATLIGVPVILGGGAIAWFLFAAYACRVAINNGLNNLFNSIRMALDEIGEGIQQMLDFIVSNLWILAVAIAAYLIIVYFYHRNDRL